LSALGVRPAGAVDALQHGVLGIAAPIGAGHLGQLEGLELAGARHMRAAAKVFEIALAVERQGFAFRDGADQFGLVVLAQLLEMGDGFVARQVRAG
jgi:hypothetical protein